MTAASIIHLAYCRVAANVTPTNMAARTHSSGVDAFLLDHRRGLLAKATNRESPMASFADQASRDLFEDLRSGADEAFYAAAQTVAAKLAGQMDGRTAPGLCVCVRIAEGSNLSAAVLKLEVTTPNAAVLDRLDSGEEIIEAATDVLDAPGQLQKGALVTDPRPESEVVVGDKLAVNALYFPKALGIRLEARPKDGTAALVSALHSRLPTATETVVNTLPSVDESSTEKVLEKIAEQIPELTEELQSEVSSALSERRRPVRRVDTRAPLKRVVRAGPITISGPAQAMRAVDWNPRPEGDYLITIVVPDEPESEYE